MKSSETQLTFTPRFHKLMEKGKYFRIPLPASKSTILFDNQVKEAKLIIKQGFTVVTIDL